MQDELGDPGFFLCRFVPELAFGKSPIALPPRVPGGNSSPMVSWVGPILAEAEWRRHPGVPRFRDEIPTLPRGWHWASLMSLSSVRRSPGSAAPSTRS